MGGFSGIQGAVARAVGALGLPDISGNTAPNPANTTTAVNMAIVANGRLQGLIRSMSVDEQFNVVRVRAINNAVAAAIIPGVYEATASISKSFIFGQSVEGAFGGGLRAVVGEYQGDPDFTKFYFNILQLDNFGNILSVYHDCVLMSVRRSVEIESVVVMDDAQIAIRWADTS